MAEPIEKNKHGQAIGRKGLQTKQHLMNATRKLLRKRSPVELTVLAIAKEVDITGASFYLYFNDVKDILFTLSEAVEEDMSEVVRLVEEPWAPGVLALEHAIRVVEAFAAVWKKHREVLRYRNLEADRGDKAFEELRLRSYMRIINSLSQKIYESYPADLMRTRNDAMAEAGVVVAAMERMASTSPRQVERGVGEKAMWDAMARIMARTLNPGDASISGKQ